MFQIVGGINLISFQNSLLTFLFCIVFSEKAMATHSSTLAWKNPMDKGAW